MQIITCAIFLLAALNYASAYWLDVEAARSNSLQVTWKAAVSPRFHNVSRLEAIAMMGVPMHEHAHSLISLPKSSVASLAVPEAFSVAEQWPQCGAYIADQGEPFSARIAIHNATSHPILQASAARAGRSELASRLPTASASQATRPRCSTRRTHATVQLAFRHHIGFSERVCFSQFFTLFDCACC
jgi:hypothetical protein